MTTITALPTPPSRDDPANFASRGDAFMAALPTFVTQTNTVAGEVNTNATNAANSASSASTSASTATTQAGLATSNGAAQVALATAQATNAANSAASAINAPGTSATSTTSTLIGTGSKTLTITTGKAFALGQVVAIARTSAPSTYAMYGTITAHNSGTGSLTVEVSNTQGSGTYSDWTVSLSTAGSVPAASQVEMETGTEPSIRGMSPLRVQQAITAQTYNGATTTTSAATTVTLTASSAQLQVINFSTSGGIVKLPDPTTMTLKGSGAFHIQNIGQDTIVQDNNSVSIGSLRSGSSALIMLDENNEWTPFVAATGYSTFGAESTFHTGTLTSGRLVKLLRLSSTTAFVIYREQTTSAGYYAKILTVNPDLTISAGSASSNITASSSLQFSVALLDATNVIATYVDSGASTALKAVVLSISGTAITVNTPGLATVNASGINSCAVAALSSTSAIVVYSDSNGSPVDSTYGAVLSISGITVTSTETQIDTTASNSSPLDVIALSSTLAVCTYGETSTNARMRVLVISGTTITPNTEFASNVGTSTTCNKLLKLSATSFIGIFGNNLANALRLGVFSISGTTPTITITMLRSLYFDTTGTTSQFTVGLEVLADGRYVVSIPDSSTLRGALMFFNDSGSAVTFENMTVFKTTQVSSTSVVALSPDLILTAAHRVSDNDGMVTALKTRGRGVSSFVSTNLMAEGTFGFAPGSGSQVTQTPSKTALVSTTTPTGEIQMGAGSLAASTDVSFPFVNPYLGVNDVLYVQLIGGTSANYMIRVSQTSSNSAVLTLRNISSSPLDETVNIRYAIIKSSNT